MDYLELIYTDPETGEVTVDSREELAALKCRPALRLRALQVQAKINGEGWSVRTEDPPPPPEPEEEPA